MSVKVSIIIPVYKVPEPYLRGCLDSIAVQDLREMECLLISDGAPEKEKSICKEYAEKDKRFRFIEKEHSGVSATRNLGIREANGEYITFVDADDWLEKDAIKTLLGLIENGADIGLANFKKVSDKKTTPPILKLTNSVREIDVLDIPNFVVWNYIFKRELILRHNIFFVEQLSYSEDQVFIYQYFDVCKYIASSNQTTYNYRLHKDSVCHQSISFDFLENQYIAANYIEKVLSQKNINFSKKKKFKTAKMATTAFLKHNPVKEHYSKLRKLYINFISENPFGFYHCYYRSKIAALFEKYFFDKFFT